MKRLTAISLLLLSAVSSGWTQGGPGYYGARYTRLPDGDSIKTVYLWRVYISPVSRAKAQARRANRNSVKYNKLIYNVRKVYPIALEAKAKLAEIEAHLLTLPDEKSQRAYINLMEKELKAQYTPVLKQMTFSQGKILIKLIDRETDRTSYQLLKELKSGFSAFMWQSIARLFGADLKQTYDGEGTDREIEEIIRMYELGII